MPFTRTIVTTVKEGSTTLGTGTSVAVTGNTRVDLVVTTAAATADQPFAVEINTPNIQQIFLLSTVDADLYTNDVHDGSPNAHVVLKAGVPVFFSAGIGQSNPFVTVPVTSIYVGVAGAVAGLLSLYCIENC